MTGEFFEHRREWSRWKHRLLQRYLGQFFGITRSTHKTVWFIDGFAGEGRYQNPPEDGSPVLAARIAAEMAATSQGCQLRCINIEPDGYEALCAATSEFGAEIVENRRGLFAENVDAVLELIGSDPALFFLDPCGHKGMEWDVVTRVLGRARSGITEVLLNFFITKIDLHGGYLRSTEKQAPKFVTQLDQLFGTEAWRTLWDGGKPQHERIAALTDLYMNRLSEAIVASAAHGIVSRYPVRTIGGDLKYYILHGTGHPRGARAMSEAVYRVSLEYEEARATAVQAELDAAPQPSLFGAETPPSPQELDEAIVRGLRGDIVALPRTSRSFTPETLEETLLPKWFGRAVEKHFRAACAGLIEDGVLRLVGGVAPRRRGTRIVLPSTSRIEFAQAGAASAAPVPTLKTRTTRSPV